MAIHAAAKSKIYIGTTKATSLVADYTSDTWTEVGQVEDIGEFGDKAEQIKFTALSDSRVRKLKGARDAGTLEVTVARDSTDAGQDALRAAAAADVGYNFKIVLNDKIDTSGSTFYFKALVNGSPIKMGDANAVIRQVFSLDVSSDILEVEAV
jgi:hypothetical protein